MDQLITHPSGLHRPGRDGIDPNCTASGLLEAVYPGFRGLGILYSWAARAWRRLSWGVADTHQSFTRKVLDLVASGHTVTDVARDLEISGQTIYAWRHQDRIDKGD